jgi:hypothetical protein
MADNKVRVVETSREYELLAAGLLDKFRVIPRLIMLAYIYAFYQSTVWFMALTDPTNAQAAFISTIVGAGAAFFGLYVGKAASPLPKGRKK